MILKTKNGATPTQPRNRSAGYRKRRKQPTPILHRFVQFFKSSDEWYAYYQKKTEELKELEAKLAAETEEHQKTRQQLREALNNQEGEQDHGESN